MKKAHALCLIILLYLAGCATAGFTYKWYGLEAESYQGKLLGPDPSLDLEFTKCQPDPDASPDPSPNPAPSPEKGKCVVMLSSEFFAMKLAYEQLQKDLSNCQQGSR